jgi:hypothetical protein
MKRITPILVCALTLALAGLTTVVMAAGAKRATKATVRAVHGDVQYSTDGGQWKPLRPNMDLPEGTSVKTGADSGADMQVNGRTSTVRVTADTTMTLKQMEAIGAGMAADTETLLKLDGGTVMGSVKKISGDSHYQVSTPRGVAGVRGTDFQVVVTALPSGLFTVTFTSVTGQVICVSNITINGTITPVTKILTSGMSWTPPENETSADAVNPVPMLPGILIEWQNNPLTPITVTLPTPPPPPIQHQPPTTNPSETGGTSGT